MVFLFVTVISIHCVRSLCGNFKYFFRFISIVGSGRSGVKENISKVYIFFYHFLFNNIVYCCYQPFIRSFGLWFINFSNTQIECIHFNTSVHTTYVICHIRPLMVCYINISSIDSVQHFTHRCQLSANLYINLIYYVNARVVDSFSLFFVRHW